MTDVAASQNAEGSTPDRTPSNTTDSPTVVTEVFVGKEEGLDETPPDHARFDGGAIEMTGELTAWGPTFVEIDGQYINVDRIESVSIDGDGRTLLTLIGRRPLVIDLSVDELLAGLGVDE